jgi:predicted ArsR family transcriptional regulator
LIPQNSFFAAKTLQTVKLAYTEDSEGTKTMTETTQNIPRSVAMRESILNYLTDYPKLHSGLAPSMRQLADAVGTSAPGVGYHLDILESEGFITCERRPTGERIARSISVTAKGKRGYAKTPRQSE